jgi:hypothetical protein
MMPRPPESALGAMILLTALAIGIVLITEALVNLFR